MGLTPEEYMHRLLEVTAKKRTLMQELLVLTQKQAEVLHEDGLDALQKLVDDKQVRIDAVNKLDEDFDVYFRRLKSELKVNSLEEAKCAGIQGAKELQEAVAGVIQIVQQIGVLEKENNTKAQGLLNKFGDEVKRVNIAKKANSAYAPGPIQTSSYFIDKKK